MRPSSGVGRPPPRRAEAGFTLLEVVLATSLLLLALGLAAGLLRESGLLLAAARHESLEAAPELVLAQLRSDIQRSRGLGGGAAPGELVLAFADGSRLRWLVREETLVRERESAEGVLEERGYLRGATRLTWTTSDGCLLDVAVTFADRDRLPRWTAPRPAPPTPVLRTLDARVACRDLPRGGGF
jgi:hypothetical protein